MRVVPVGSRKKQTKTPKKPSISKRKIAKRRVTFESSNWYQAAALSVGIPEDRREQR